MTSPQPRQRTISYRLRRVNVTPTGYVSEHGKPMYVATVSESDGSMPEDCFRELLQNLKPGEFVVLLGAT